MLTYENVEAYGFIEAIRGMRNPLNSWDKSDSEIRDGSLVIGPKDFNLAMKLAKAGPVEAKYRRMISVYVHITAPLYWWKEFDTYKVGTVSNSCSTMHTLHTRDLTLDDFSCEHLVDIDGQNIPLSDEQIYGYNYKTILETTIRAINSARLHYLETGDKMWWWQMIQLLPSSYNQKRTIVCNYEVLSNIYKSRKAHKLDEWHEFCNMIEGLPYSSLITGINHIS